MYTSDMYDMVVIGAGPAGLMLSTQLARWGYRIKHIDNRPEPTRSGRADGIQPRTLDLLKNMGLKRNLMAKNPARVFEVAFWDPSDDKKGIYRSGTWASCPDFIDARHRYTTLIHQGHIERLFIRDIEKNGLQIQRPWTITGFATDGRDSLHPVEVQLKHMNTNERETIRTKYLFSAEGARSFVREQLGIPVLHKDPIAHVWGVMDGVVETNFPDIKVLQCVHKQGVTNTDASQMKCTIHSDHGSIMVIPRENNMVRLYIQIASSSDKDWNPRMTATEKQVQESAQRTLHPYKIEWESVDWYSVYPIGQGIAERYTLDERVFMGGDACHTHSPKAGQGMNTAFMDANNLAWKIHAVESGFASPSILSTYESERKSIAEALLDFDAEYAKLFSARLPSAGEVKEASQSSSGDSSSTRFVELFKSSCEFTSGYGASYSSNVLNWSSSHPAQSNLFIQHEERTALQIGHLFPPAKLRRVIDSNVVDLQEDVPVNGSFRVYIFGGHVDSTKEALNDFSSNLQRRNSFYQASERADVSSVSHHERHNPHSRFFTLCIIFANRRSDIEISMLPPLLARYQFHIYADDVEDIRMPGSDAAVHAKLKLDLGSGAVVVVRPDGFIGCAVRLVKGTATVDALNSYFSAFSAQTPGAKTLQARL